MIFGPYFKKEKKQTQIEEKKLLSQEFFRLIFRGCLGGT